jgi:hypothetical protein
VFTETSFIFRRSLAWPVGLPGLRVHPRMEFTPVYPDPVGTRSKTV